MASVFPDNRREQFLEKPLPSSEESERVILGSILLDNALIAQAVEHLKPEDFYSPLNRRVFAAMIALFEKQKQIDPILIGEELKKTGELEALGGVAAISAGVVRSTLAILVIMPHGPPAGGCRLRRYGESVYRRAPQPAA